MKRCVCLAVLILLLSGCGSSSTDYSRTFEEGRIAVSDILAQTGGSSLSIAFVADGDVVWAEAFGLANKESQTAPTVDTMFGIGSVSKMLATVATMKLVDEGKISLDEPVASYIPSFSMLSPEYAQITVRMLLNHSSGFPGSDYRNSATSNAYTAYADQVLTSLSEERLKHAPGYLNTYCNDGFTMLEELIAYITGESFVQYVQDEVLTLLGMDHSRYPTEAFPDGSYVETYTGSQKNSFLFGNPYASGGFYSTPSDMARLALMFLGRGTVNGRRLLSETAVDEMAEDQTLGTFDPVPEENERFGLGWDSVSEGGLKAVNVTAWAKGGDIGSFGADMIVAPEDNLAVVVTGASGISSSNATVVAERIMLQALVDKGRIAQFPTPLPETPKEERAPTADELSAITGYFATSGMLFHIEANADDSITFSLFDGTTWNVYMSGLKMRDDGMFSTDAAPLTEYYTVTGDGRTYLVKKALAGYRHYQDSSLICQKISSAVPLSASWNARLGKTWLLVNERPDAIFSASVTVPLFSFSEPEGLAGLLVANTHDGVLNVVDPSEDDMLAGMMLLLPQAGRDINDVFIISNGGEEWIRYGGSVYRPQETVADISSGGTVTIGDDGYAQWRTVSSGGVPKEIAVTTSGTWRVFDSSLTWVSTTDGSGTASLPPVSGKYYIVVFGGQGDSIAIAVN